MVGYLACVVNCLTVFVHLLTNGRSAHLVLLRCWTKSLFAVSIQIDSSKTLICDLQNLILSHIPAAQRSAGLVATRLDLYKVVLPSGLVLDGRVRKKIEELKRQDKERKVKELDRDPSEKEGGPLNPLCDLLPDFGPDYWNVVPSHETVHLLVDIFHRRGTLTPRTKLVEHLYKAAEEHKFIQVRGIPASGKSVVLNLLHNYIYEALPEIEIYRIDSWPKSDIRSYVERLKGITGEFPSTSPTYLLFDEGQGTYADADLWKDFFKCPSDNYRIVIFCDYGSASGQTEISTGSPHAVPNRQQLQLLPTKDFPYGLFLTRDEFDDMISRSNMNINLDEDVCDTIFDWTRGNVGSVQYFVQSIRDKNADLQVSGHPYTSDMFYSQHPDEPTAKDFINDTLARGLPMETELAARGTATLFRELLKDPRGFIKVEENSSTVSVLNEWHKKGWLYSEETSDDFILYSMPTPVHRSYISWLL